VLIGYLAGNALTGNNQNVFVGDCAGMNATSNNNVCVGLNTDASGASGVAVGPNASVAANAVAIGSNSEASGSGSIAIGLGADTKGTNCIAIGGGTGTKNFTGINNVCVGQASLASISNNSVKDSTCIGAYAGTAISTGANNTCLGSYAGWTTTVEDNVVAIGFEALATADKAVSLGNAANASGDAGVAFGSEATASGTESVAIGYQSTASQAYSVALGFGATTTTNRQVMIGSTSGTTNIISVVPGVTSVQDLGSSSLKFNDLYLNGNLVGFGGITNGTRTDSTATITVTADDYFIQCSYNGAKTLNLPNVVVGQSQQFMILNGNSGALTITATGGATIDDGVSTTKSLSGIRDHVLLISDGNLDWWSV